MSSELWDRLGLTARQRRKLIRTRRYYRQFYRRMPAEQLYWAQKRSEGILDALASVANDIQHNEGQKDAG